MFRPMTSGAVLLRARGVWLGLFLAAASPGCASRGATGLVLFGGRTDVAVFAFDGATGRLAERTRVAMPGRTAYLAVSPDRRFVFAGNGEPPGRVTSFSLHPAGALQRIGEQSTALDGDAQGISHVAVHPGGRWLLTAHLKSGRLSVLPIGDGARLGPPTFTELFAVGAHQVVVDRAGRHALVPVRDGQFVATFRIDTAAGRLLPGEPARVPSAPGSGPRHLSLTPDERFAYVNNESNGTVTAYRYDAARGALLAIATVPSVPEGYAETGTGHILVHPGGRFLYASNRFHGSIAAYAIDPATGRLTLLEIESAGGDLKFPRDFDITPGGRFLIVGNERGDSISVLAVDPATGHLERVAPPNPAPLAPQVIVAL
jgi:6-phosphogluconolactonase